MYQLINHEMVVMDAACANVDRHAGNCGFMVDNASGMSRGRPGPPATGTPLVRKLSS